MHEARIKDHIWIMKKTLKTSNCGTCYLELMATKINNMIDMILMTELKILLKSYWIVELNSLTTS